MGGKTGSIPSVVRHGLGTLIDEEEGILYYGHWENDLMHGDGHLFFLRANVYYSGNFMRNIFDGMGIYYCTLFQDFSIENIPNYINFIEYYINKHQFTSTPIHSLMPWSVPATLTDEIGVPNLDKSKHEFIANPVLDSCYDTLFNYKTNYYTGNFRANQFHGQGMYADKTGTHYKGQFYNGYGPGLVS